MVRIIKENSGKCIQNVLFEMSFLKAFGDDTEERCGDSSSRAAGTMVLLEEPGPFLIISSELLIQAQP